MASAWGILFSPLAGTPAEQAGQIHARIADFVNVVGAFGGIIALILWPRRDDDVELFDLPDLDRQLKVMNDFMKRSTTRQVVIFSGDFDFLGKHDGLFETLSDLATRDRLTLVSDRSAEVVKTASGDSPRVLELLENLSLSGRIAFDSGLTDVRCSLIRDELDNVILCKATVDNLQRTCAIHNRGRTEKVVEAFASVVDDVVRRTPVSRMFGGDRRSVAVIVTGETKSGKSELVKRIAEQGFHKISAGREIAELLPPGPDYPTRRQLLDKGAEFLSPDGQKKFGEILLGRSWGFERVVFDGVRLPGSIDEIKRALGTAFVVYVEADPAVRRERYEESSDGSISFEEVNVHPVERCVTEIRRQNDVVLDGTKGVGENVAHVMREIAAKYELGN